MIDAVSIPEFSLYFSQHPHSSNKLYVSLEGHDFLNLI